MNNKKIDVDDFIKSNEISLMEKAFSFKPDNRKGYDRVRRENKISDRIGNELYRKRFSISESIVSNRSMKPHDALNNSLIENNISPNSVTGWYEYVKFLYDTHGGWDVFCDDLENSLNFLNYYKNKTNGYIYQAFLGVIIAVIIMMFMWRFNIYISVAFYVLPVMVWYVIMNYYTDLSFKEKSGDYLGRNKKSSDLYSFRKIRPYIH